jgi:hypothetical protein
MLSHGNLVANSEHPGCRARLGGARRRLVAAIPRHGLIGHVQPVFNGGLSARMSPLTPCNACRLEAIAN